MEIGFVFPGQGSQSLGMLGGLAKQCPPVRHTFAEASDALELDLWALCQHGPAEALDQTENTQPVLLAAGVAVWRVWLDLGGPTPRFMAGHSLGEYSALVAAGAMALADAIRLVAARGRFMQQAVPFGRGAMAAIIGLDDAAVVAACSQASTDSELVSAANFNAPGQIVIAGAAHAVDRAIELTKAAGARKAMPLAVSVPSHCALMRPAADHLAEMLTEVPLRVPEIAVIQNTDVAVHQEPDQIRAALLKQLHQPVRWVATIEAMREAGLTALAESGPGRVLTGLIRRIDRQLDGRALHELDAIESAIQDWGGQS